MQSDGKTHLKRAQRESSTMAITPPARVRNRILAAEAEIADDVLNEFIADEQAFVEAYAGKTSPYGTRGTGHTRLLSGAAPKSFFFAVVAAFRLRRRWR